ncbi:hypothetical protein ACEPPN_006767 [Leptodophora sp. 'Broadleaf-Isolate-01']
MAARPRTEPITAPAIGPLFSLFFEASDVELDDASGAGVAFPAVARVEVLVEVRELEDLELKVDVDETLELKDEESDEEEDENEEEDEDGDDDDEAKEVALLLEAGDDVVLAAAENGLKLTPVKTICKSTSEA